MWDTIRIVFGFIFFATEAFIIRHFFSVIIVTFRTCPIEILEARDCFTVFEVCWVFVDPFLKTA